MKKVSVIVLFFSFVVFIISCSNHEKPTLFLIGDSTVKSGWGKGEGGLYGWGQLIGQYFDTTKINIENHARGGTSSRTYRSFGLWDSCLVNISQGDFVLMQFGHNDDGPINDDFRARGTIYGIGDETEGIENMLTGKHEVVHSYGWYMSAYINEVKEKGAVPIIVSPIPRNKWEGGMVPRNDDKYGVWAKQVAERESIHFIDLNDKLASVMESLGQDSVANFLFFDRDHTHTTAQGANVAASLVVGEIQEIQDFSLKKYLLKNPEIRFPEPVSVP